MFSKNKDTTTTARKDETAAATAATAAAAAAAAAAANNNAAKALKWHLRIKECERGRKATVDAKLLAIRDHLTALVHLCTAAHQETALTHRFMLGMALAQEQMAQAHNLGASTSTTTSTSTSSATSLPAASSTTAASAEHYAAGPDAVDHSQKTATQLSEAAAAAAAAATVSQDDEPALFPTLSLEQSNELMQQKLQACAADIRANVLLMPQDTKNSSSNNTTNNDDSFRSIDDNNNTNTGLHQLLITIQQQIRDLKRGQDYAEQLEELQRRIQKAWEAYLTRANISFGLGSDGQSVATGQSNKSNSSSGSGNVSAKNKKKGNNSKETENNEIAGSSKTKEDLWLAEWYYRNLVSKQAQAWDKASTRLAKLFRDIRTTESQRRIHIRDHLVLFSEFQQKLFVGMEAASNIALMDYVSKDNRGGGAATASNNPKNSSSNASSSTAAVNADSPHNAQAAAAADTKSTGFFGGFQQKLLGAAADASDAPQKVEAENSLGAAAASAAITSLTATGETTQTEAAAVRKNVEDRLQTDIHRHLEEHHAPSTGVDENKTTQTLSDADHRDRDNILGFYQDIFPPESPLESDHVVMSTVVQKNKKFLQPGTTNVMILEGLALVVVTTENVVHLFDLRENARVDESTLDGNTTPHIITLHSSPTLAYRAILEQYQRDQLTTLSSSSSSSAAAASSSQSIKSRMVATASSAISSSIHGGLSSSSTTTPTTMSEQVQESPEPCVSLPLLESSLDTMRQENSIAIVHVKSSTRLELILPSAYEQVGMINTFARQAAAAAEKSSSAAEI